MAIIADLELVGSTPSSRFHGLKSVTPLSSPKMENTAPWKIDEQEGINQMQSF